MNVDQIYQLQRDDAFADQFEDDCYRTFVAMPFSSRGGYPEKRIRRTLAKVHDLAQQKASLLNLPRSFSPLQRVDDGDPAALVITDEIIRLILGSHFFVGDLTGANHGVLLESGIAFALKPNARVLLFSQDGTSGLHFDLKVTNVIPYVEEDLAEKVADSLLAAARSYEQEAERYVSHVSAQLSPSAHIVLNLFGRLYKGYNDGPLPAMFDGIAAQMDSRFEKDTGRTSFEATARELIARRLMWTHWEAGLQMHGDGYGIHATKLGWRVIEHIWQHDPEMRMPTRARTGPNQNSRHPRLAARDS